MRIPEKILDKAFEIGFNYRRESYWDKASVSVPCCVKMKSGQQFEMAELVLTEKLYNETEYTFFQIEEVESILHSEYALTQEFRKASMTTPEYRNDWPFFIKAKNGLILGYNAYMPVNFTYKNDLKGNEIIEIIDFNNAQSTGFEFIKDHSKKSIKILCGYDIELIEKIKTVYNTR
jgi:hypothetical protein